MNNSPYLDGPLRTVEEVLYERAMKVAGTPKPAMARLLANKRDAALALRYETLGA